MFCYVFYEVVYISDMKTHGPFGLRATYEITDAHFKIIILEKYNSFLTRMTSEFYNPVRFTCTLNK